MHTASNSAVIHTIAQQRLCSNADIKSDTIKLAGNPSLSKNCTLREIRYI